MLAVACGGDSDTATVQPPEPTTNVASPTTAPAEQPTAPAANGQTPDPTATVIAAAPAPEPAPPPPVAIPDGLALKLTQLVEVDRPIDMAVRPGSRNLFVATKGGQVLEISVSGDVGRVERELLDISDRILDGAETGLLGLTFSPDGEWLFLSYSDVGGDNVLVQVPMAGDVVDFEDSSTLLTVDQPRGNHNGGDIAFGPDGYLYVALGDGGGAGDPFATGQDPTSWLGSILRIDPMDDGTYAIPADNPFVDDGGASEVFLYGVRNPWRISFDRSTGDLWIADVGQGAVEEVNVAYASAGGGNGANLGWSRVEGNEPFSDSSPPADSYLAPIHTYGRQDGCSVTGGHVYRADAIRELQGIYVFGDFCSGLMWGFASSELQGELGRFDLGLTIGSDGLASFGEGPDGELYVLSFANTVSRIDRAG